MYQIIPSHLQTVEAVEGGVCYVVQIELDLKVKKYALSLETTPYITEQDLRNFDHLVHALISKIDACIVVFTSGCFFI